LETIYYHVMCICKSNVACIEERLICSCGILGDCLAEGQNDCASTCHKPIFGRPHLHELTDKATTMRYNTGGETSPSQANRRWGLYY